MLRSSSTRAMVGMSLIIPSRAKIPWLAEARKARLKCDDPPTKCVIRQSVDDRYKQKVPIRHVRLFLTSLTSSDLCCMANAVNRGRDMQPTPDFDPKTAAKKRDAARRAPGRSPP